MSKGWHIWYRINAFGIGMAYLVFSIDENLQNIIYCFSILQIHFTQSSPSCSTCGKLYGFLKNGNTNSVNGVTAVQTNLENTLKERSQRIVTFETLIAFLTMENNNLNPRIDPSIKSAMGYWDSPCNLCDVFCKPIEFGPF